jgi:uncharacterized protein (DUF2225 family)
MKKDTVMSVYLLSRITCNVCRFRDTDSCKDECLVGRIGMMTMEKCAEMMDHAS